jgi:glucose-6-phosphate 1-dehydrogenase
MIPRLVLFGATGDLAARYLFPALAAIHATGRLPSPFSVTGTARDTISDDAFRMHVAEALSTHSPDVPLDSRAEIKAATGDAAVDIADATELDGEFGTAYRIRTGDLRLERAVS